MNECIMYFAFNEMTNWIAIVKIIFVLCFTGSIMCIIHQYYDIIWHPCDIEIDCDIYFTIIIYLRQKPIKSDFRTNVNCDW